MSKEDGGPAFPNSEKAVGYGFTDGAFDGFTIESVDGMSLHDWYKGLAMQGLLSNPALADIVAKDSGNWIASKARSQADAMIADMEEVQ